MAVTIESAKERYVFFLAIRRHQIFVFCKNTEIGVQ